MIEKYNFGSIVIDNKNYDYDVEVRWSGEVLKWWRKESHIFALEDVKRAIEQEPDIIILGTGANGLAEASEQAKEFIKEKGIELIIDKTNEAVKTFNIINEKSKEEQGRKTKVIGLFHLTC